MSSNSVAASPTTSSFTVTACQSATATNEPLMAAAAAARAVGDVASWHDRASMRSEVRTMTTNSTRRPFTLGAVAYDPKVVTIWEGFAEWFASHDFAFDYVLYSNYEAQADAHLAGDVDVTWDSPLAWVRTRRLAAAAGRAARAVAMRDTDQDLTSVVLVRADGDVADVAELEGRRGRHRGRRLTAGHVAAPRPPRRRRPRPRYVVRRAALRCDGRQARRSRRR